MENLKALEILKECKNYAELWSVDPISNEEQKWITYIDEAIKELKALQAKLEEYEEFYIHRNEVQAIQSAKTCDGCIYEESNYDLCYKCKRFHIDLYSQKAQQ